MRELALVENVDDHRPQIGGDIRVVNAREGQRRWRWHVARRQRRRARRRRRSQTELEEAVAAHVEAEARRVGVEQRGVERQQEAARAAGGERAEREHLVRAQVDVHEHAEPNEQLANLDLEIEPCPHAREAQVKLGGHAERAVLSEPEAARECLGVLRLLAHGEHLETVELVETREHDVRERDGDIADDLVGEA